MENNRRMRDDGDGPQVDLLTGQEKYHDESEVRTEPAFRGVSYEDTVNKTNEQQLVHDVSSTAVLTPLDDDLVGEITEVEERGNWSGRFDFLMSLLGYSVGLGNVWRFPYLAYTNGGGAFVFPFILMLLLLGLPLMMMELSLGQFAAMGPAIVFDKLCPIFSGLGYGMITVSALVGVYYTVIISWCILYLFISLTSELPWERCHEQWASKFCYSYEVADACQATNGSLYLNSTCFNASYVMANNLTNEHGIRHAPAQDFFEREILKKSDGLEFMGMPQWKIVLCLMAAWTLAFGALSKGVKSTGKVVYFTALFPYVVLFILFFRGVTLPGAVNGILLYITPDFQKLGDAKVWSDAAAQIFFALSPAWGGLITLSSYNKFHNNCFKDTLIVSIGNILTSLFAGFVIFCIIGYLASELDMDVKDVVDEGAGLAFVVYPDVVTRLPISPIWSVLFFVMMITLGMGSLFALLETFLTAIQDTWPALRQKKTYLVAGVSLVGFLTGLPVTTEGGLYLLQLMDNYVSSWCVFLMAILECVIIGWIYGAEKFINNIEQMIGVQKRPFHVFFSLFWKYFSPFTLTFVLIFNLIQYRPLTLGKYVYSPTANGIGWLISSLPLVFISIFVIHKFCTVAPRNLSLRARLHHCLRPTKDWGPAHKDVFHIHVGSDRGHTIINSDFKVHLTPGETSM